jgi:hypothetical protein
MNEQKLSRIMTEHPRPSTGRLAIESDGSILFGDGDGDFHTALRQAMRHGALYFKILSCCCTLFASLEDGAIHYIN